MEVLNSVDLRLSRACGDPFILRQAQDERSGDPQREREKASLTG